MIETILYAFISAIVYASSMFVKKHASSTNPQDFDITKFASTIIVAVIIAATMIGAGATVVTEADIVTQLALYAGMIAVTENIIKVLYRKITV